MDATSGAVTIRWMPLGYAPELVIAPIMYLGPLMVGAAPLLL